MGLAASQARLLTLTTRLSRLELEAQNISNTKLRLASANSDASDKFQAALNAKKISILDTSANKYIEATASNLTAYNPSYQQRMLKNSCGAVLVSEEIAGYYEDSGGVLEEFLNPVDLSTLDAPGQTSYQANKLSGQQLNSAIDAVTNSISRTPTGNVKYNMNAATHYPVAPTGNSANDLNTLKNKQSSFEKLKGAAASLKPVIDAFDAYQYAIEKANAETAGTGIVTFIMATIATIATAGAAAPAYLGFIGATAGVNASNNANVQEKLNAFNALFEPLKNKLSALGISVGENDTGDILAAKINKKAVALGINTGIDKNLTSLSADQVSTLISTTAQAFTDISADVTAVKATETPIYTYSNNMADTNSNGNADEMQEALRNIIPILQEIGELFNINTSSQINTITGFINGGNDGFSIGDTGELQQIKAFLSGLKSSLNVNSLNNAGLTNPLSTDKGGVTYYTNLFNEMKQYGYVTTSDENLNNPDWLSQQLISANLYLSEDTDSEDGQVKFETINWETGDSSIIVEDDDSEVARAKAEYEATMDEISVKESKLDVKLEQIDTEHNATKTEVDSVQKVIDKNIERTFKVFDA